MFEPQNQPSLVTFTSKSGGQLDLSQRLHLLPDQVWDGTLETDAGRQAPAVQRGNTEAPDLGPVPASSA